MVVCDECQRPYITQTYNIGKQRRRSEAQIYRHRIDRGHCQNKSIRAEVLEEIVWQEIVSILEDPYALRKGYEESLEQHKATLVRQQMYLETLEKNAAKLELEKKNLIAAYIDPEVPLPKAIYIEQMTRIEDELNSIDKDLESRRSDLASIPTPADLASLEIFSERICQHLDTSNPSPEEKRHILELLHITVKVDLNGYVRLEGWFIPQEDDGLLNQPSRWLADRCWCRLRPRRPLHPTR
jgi:site-specific DNA recombinase